MTNHILVRPPNQQNCHSSRLQLVLCFCYIVWCLKQYLSARTLHHRGERNILQTLECESLSGRVVAPSWELETRCYPGGVHRPNGDTLPVVSFHYAAQPCTDSSNTWFCLFIHINPHFDAHLLANDFSVTFSNFLRNSSIVGWRQRLKVGSHNHFESYCI